MVNNEYRTLLHTLLHSDANVGMNAFDIYYFPFHPYIPL